MSEDSIMTGSSKKVEDLRDSSSNPLTKKLNKILETRIDTDKDVIEALKSLSLFFEENTIRTRRSLRSDIEKRFLSINKDFIDSFSVVKKQLDQVYQEVQSMNQCCQDMTSKLKKTKSQTNDLIKQTAELQGEASKLDLRQKMVDIFLKKFQLTEEETLALKTNKDGSLHKDFFSSLERVRQIHSDCKLLLRTNHQATGLEIMEAMALEQEAAFEKLYRWLQNECCLLTSDSPDLTGRMCQAMQALQERPVLFKYIIDEFSKARRAAVVRNFIDALTRGGVVGGVKNSRPIELHSHDPLRYLGDMLAWIHQACASEKEHIAALLKNCKDFDKMDSLMEDVLSHITEGVCRPLKMRMEQVLANESNPSTLHRITSLIHFYKTTISHLLKTDSGLMFCIDEMHKLSNKLFFSSLTLSANKMLDKVEAPPPDLSPPSQLTSTINLLKNILSSHDSSLSSGDEKKNIFQQILSTIIDPLIQMCLLSASSLDSASMATYMINCLYNIQCTVSLYEFTDQRMEMLQAQLEAQLDTMVNEQTSSILNNCNLSHVCSALQHQDPQTALSSLPGLDCLSLKNSLSHFEKFLNNPDSLTLPHVSRLQTSKFRDLVRKRSTELIEMAYKQLYEAVRNPNNLYPQVQTIVPISPDEVHKLLN